MSTRALDALEASALSRLPAPAREHLAAWATLVDVPAGQVIAREGDPAEAMFVIAQGRVALGLHQRQAELTVATLGRGDLLGWSWAVEPHAWQFDATALEHTTLVRLGEDALRGVADSDPSAGYELTRAMVAMLARRLRDARVQLLDLFAAERGGT